MKNKAEKDLMRKHSWSSAFKIIGKSDPVLQMKSLELENSMMLGQGRLVSDELFSEAPRCLYFSIKNQHPPNVPRS